MSSIGRWCGSEPEVNDDRAFLARVVASRRGVHRKRPDGGVYRPSWGPASLWAILRGPGLRRETVQVQHEAPEARARRERAEALADRREQAMQTGMAFGCEGYNDVMGY